MQQKATRWRSGTQESSHKSESINDRAKWANIFIIKSKPLYVPKKFFEDQRSLLLWYFFDSSKIFLSPQGKEFYFKINFNLKLGMSDISIGKD